MSQRAGIARSAVVKERCRCASSGGRLKKLAAAAII